MLFSDVLDSCDFYVFISRCVLVWHVPTQTPIFETEHSGVRRP
jgi:hypothetical protein